MLTKLQMSRELWEQIYPSLSTEVFDRVRKAAVFTAESVTVGPELSDADWNALVHEWTNPSRTSKCYPFDLPEIKTELSRLRSELEQSRAECAELQRHADDCRKEALEAIRVKQNAINHLEQAQFDVAELKRRLEDWQNREASVCPEDVGFVEYIGVLKRRLEEAQTALGRIREALGIAILGAPGRKICWNDEIAALDAARGKEKA